MDRSEDAMSASQVNADSVQGSLASLFQQMRSAEGRVEALRARANVPVQREAVLATFQELDAAHEELRTAEEHLHGQVDTIAQMRSALDTERRRYWELFDAAPDPYVLTDLHGNILEANRRACTLLNINAVFLSGKPLAIFVGAEDRGQFRAVLELLAHEQAVSSFELRLRPRSSLTPAWTAVSACRALGPDGVPSMLRWLLRDVTVAKDAQQRVGCHTPALEESLRERTRELTATRHLLEHSLAREKQARAYAATLVRKQDTLLAAIAHELRGPLSSVSGWLQLIALARIEPAVRERGMASMTRSVRMLTRMVEDLMDHARCKEGFFQLERVPVRLPELVSQALDESRPIASQKGVRLLSHSSDAIDSIREINADPQRLQQVLTNLLGNALKFTPKDGEVTVSLEGFERHVEIVIADTGAGIEPSFLPHVFDAFARSRQSTSAWPAGLGLGLHLSRWLVELHGGTIVAESAGLGRGARFIVTLPIDRVSRPPLH